MAATTPSLRPALRSSPASAARSLPSLKSPEGSVVKKSAQPLSLPKRLLFPSLPPGAELPPLLRSSVPHELQTELYEFISLALRAFVNSWWTKITRHDKDFLVQVNRILTVVVQSVEARIAAADLSPLILRDIPTLVEQHYADYRNAKSKLATSFAVGGAASLPQLFHQLQPHMAISVDGQIHEEYMRQVVDHILKTCLPPEDYRPETERFIVREIVLKVILESVLPKISQPWFIQKCILDALGPKQEVYRSSSQPSGSSAQTAGHPAGAGPSLQSIFIFFLHAVQTASSLCLMMINAYKHAAHTIHLVNEYHASAPSAVTSSPVFGPSSEEQTVAVETERPAGVTVQRTPSVVSTTSTIRSTSIPDPTPSHHPPSYVRPILGMLSTVVSAENRMASSAIFNTASVSATLCSPFLDKLLPFVLHTHVLSADVLVGVVRAGKNSLFPDGWPASAPIDPTPEEQAIIRRDLVDQLLKSTPPVLASFLLGPDEASRRRTVEAALDPLSSRECNMHLILFILDLLVQAIFPELGADIP